MLKKKNLLDFLADQKRVLNNIQMKVSEMKAMNFFCEELIKRVSDQEAKIKKAKRISVKEIDKTTVLGVMVNSFTKAIINNLSRSRPCQQIKKGFNRNDN